MDRNSIIQDLKRRLTLQQPAVAARLQEYFDGAETAAKDPKNAERVKSLIESALGGDKQAWRTLCEIRITAVSNYVTAKGNASSFFEEVTLAQSDEPYLKNETKQEIKARFVGTDGRVRLTQAVKSQEQERIPLRLLSTDDYEFTLIDPYKGEVADQAKLNVDLAYDLNMKREVELWKLVKAAVGNFNYTATSLAARTFNLHSSIKSANLPQSNLITLSDNSGSTKFRYAVIKAMIQWCMQWGTNTFNTGEVRPVTLFVPAADIGGMLDEVTPESFDNPIVEQILGVGYVMRLGSYQFNIVPDAALDPADGTAYLRTNRPLGQLFKKPSLDRVFPGDIASITKDEWKANKASMSMNSYHGAVVPEPWRPGVVAIKYRS